MLVRKIIKEEYAKMAVNKLKARGKDILDCNKLARRKGNKKYPCVAKFAG